MIGWRAARTALLLALAAGLMALVTLVRTPDRSVFWSALLDSVHAPLFGLFALLILRATSAPGGRDGPADGS